MSADFDLEAAITRSRTELAAHGSLDVILPAFLGAAILRLRSRLTETRLAD